MTANDHVFVTKTRHGRVPVKAGAVLVKVNLSPVQQVNEGHF